MQGIIHAEEIQLDKLNGFKSGEKPNASGKGREKDAEH